MLVTIEGFDETNARAHLPPGVAYLDLPSCLAACNTCHSRRFSDPLARLYCVLASTRERSEHIVSHVDAHAAPLVVANYVRDLLGLLVDAPQLLGHAAAAAGGLFGPDLVLAPHGYADTRLRLAVTYLFPWAEVIACEPGALAAELNRVFGGSPDVQRERMASAG